MLNPRHRAYLLTIILTLTLLMPTTTCTYADASSPLDLGRIPVRSKQEALKLFSQTLDRGQPGFYQVQLLGEAYATRPQQLDEAMDLAEAKAANSTLYFLNGAYFDPASGKYIFAIGQADKLITSRADFTRFLEDHRGSTRDQVVLKLLHYTDNSQYPYSRNFGFDGTYSCTDEPAGGDTVIRTLLRNTSADATSAKTYQVIDHEDVKAALKDAIAHFHKKIVLEVPFETSSFDLRRAYNDLRNTFTAYAFSKEIRWDESAGVYTVSITYHDDADQCKRLYERAMAEADRWVSELKPTMDDYDKILALHDRLLKNTVYDDQALHFQLDPERAFTFVGPLLYGKASHQGYTDALKVLLDKAGIRSTTLQGTLDRLDRGKSSVHTWNMVYVSGIPYHVDIAAEDTDGWRNALGFFLVGDTTLAKNHSWNRSEGAVCPSDYTKKTAPNLLNDLLLAQGQWLMAANQGLLIRSFDGSSWAIEKPQTTENLKTLSFGATRFVAAGSGGALLISDDGLNWEPLDIPVTENLYRVRYLNHRFFAVGARGTLLTSPDGLQWTICNVPTASDFYDITYGAGRYVAVGSSGALITSADGLNWALRPTGLSSEFTSVAYSSGRFLLASRSGQLMTSTDGWNWSKRSGTLHPGIHQLWATPKGFVAAGQKHLILYSGRSLSEKVLTSEHTILALINDGHRFFSLTEKGDLLASESLDVSGLKRLSITIKQPKQE